MIKHLLLIIFFSSTFIFANESDSTPKRDSIITYAQSFLKTPYLWGGTSPKGFDCSGFLYYVYKHYKVHVSRSSSGYSKYKKVDDLKHIKPADVLLFTGTNSSIRKIGHVGMVIKNENGIIDFIHASSSKRHFGVTITRFNNSGYVKRFLKAITLI